MPPKRKRTVKTPAANPYHPIAANPYHPAALSVTASTETTLAAPTTTAPVTESVYLCFESESESSHHDNVRVFAVTATFEAALLACRDLAIQKQGEYFNFSSDDWHGAVREKEFWAAGAESGEYDNQACSESRYRYSIYIEGPEEIKDESNFPTHPFPEIEEGDDDEDEDENGYEDVEEISYEGRNKKLVTVADFFGR
jgi:hypothetical protein